MATIDAQSLITACSDTIIKLFFCSDGIDRTGAFICIYSQLERIKIEGVADIFQFIKGSRFQRPNLVESVVRYYVHTLIWCTCTCTYYNI